MLFHKDKVSSSVNMTVLTIGAVTKDIKSKINFPDHQIHRILRDVYVLLTFLFIASQVMQSYYL